MSDFARREMLIGGSLLAGLGLAGRAVAKTRAVTTVAPGQQSIRPGQIWLDTSGKPIQAHAGSVIAVKDTFYWYGENKEFTTGKGDIESWGIRFYRSKDLYNWDDLGPIIPPDNSDPTSPLNPKGFPERPHIVYNPRTRKFVCWIKIRGHDPEYRTVLVADHITGPYTIVERVLRPNGMIAGDFDIVVDPRSGKAYMYFEHDHKELVCIDLNEDWTGFAGTVSRHFPRSAPVTREGIACFRRHEKLYLTSSGMTGYFPNPSEVATASDYHGPFSEPVNLFPSDRSETSFNSQISQIFKHPKKDLYIALADRWLPKTAELEGFDSGILSRLVRNGIAKAVAKPRQSLSDDERKVLPYAATLKGVDTSVSRYVWLPITFQGDRPTIEWHDEWRIEDFT